MTMLVHISSLCQRDWERKRDCYFPFPKLNSFFVSFVSVVSYLLYGTVNVLFL